MSRFFARSIVALMMVAVLAVAGVAVIMQSASASSEAGSPWVRYQLTGGSLEGVDAIAVNDAWAVGSDGLLAHWNGTAWTAYDNTKLGPRLIYGVDMLSSSQVWASAASGTMLRYDGANWLIEPTNLGTTSMFDVSMVSATDGWAVGSAGTFGDYDGTSWQQVRPGGTLTATLNGIDMVASNAGWAVGGISDQSGILGKIARYNGSAWVDDFTYNRILYDVDMLDTTYGWAVGQGGTLLEWNGSFWAAYTSPPSAAVNLQGVSVISRTNAWAVGARNSFSNDIWHWDGVNWTAVTTPNTAPLNDVFMLNSGEGWVVGERGTIYRYNGAAFLIYNTHWTSNGFYGLDFLDPRDGWAVGVLNQSPPAYGLQHWNGTFWEEYQPPAFQPTLYDVDMVTTDAAWAVGSSGYIFKWNGTAWTRDTSPPSISLYSMSMLSATDGWAVGGSGNIVHYNGTAWTSYTSPTTSNLWSIDMVNANEGWAGGISGLMLHYQNGTWTALSPNPSGFTIEGIDMLSADEGWAVGYNGTILHYQNGTWTQQASPVTSNLLNVHMLSPNSGWAVGVAPTGANATILQYVGGTWNLVPNPTGRNMRDIFMFAANEGWAVGESPGTKLYMGPLGGPTATVTRTPTITPTPTPVTCYTISDTISSSDPVQTGMVTRTFSPSTCVFSAVCPGVADTTPRHY